MTETIRHCIELRCTPQSLYEYLVQPWRWHEWHPNSRSAESDDDKLGVGSTFNENFEIQLMPGIRLKRRLAWKVRSATPFTHWEIDATTRDAEINITYQLEPCEVGVRFSRTVRYQLGGLTRLLAPLIRRRNIQQSEQALAGLKKRVENSVP